MKINALRELILRKTDSDTALHGYIHALDNNELMQFTVESLIKMAKKQSQSGKQLNTLTGRWTVHHDPIELNMLHDGASHHASQYGSAIKKQDKIRSGINNGSIPKDVGEKQINTHQNVANQHAKQLWKIMRLANKTANHTGLKTEEVDPKLWERHNTRGLTVNDGPVKNKTKKVGDPKTAPRSWNYMGSDFSWLQHVPHKSFANDRKNKDAHEEHKDSAYPMEKIKWTMPGSDKPKHLHITEGVESDKYVPHESDHHPILNEFEKRFSPSELESNKNIEKQHMNETWDKHQDFLDGPVFKQWFDRHKQDYESNPEDYKTRGHEMSDAVHTNVVPHKDLDEEYRKSNPNIENSGEAVSAPKDKKKSIEEILQGVDPEIRNSIMSKLKGIK